MKFAHSRPAGTKRVASEEIIEVEDLSKKSKGDDGPSTSSTTSDATDELITEKFAKPSSKPISVGGLSSRNSMKNLVKRKSDNATIVSQSPAKPAADPATKPASTNALTLLAGYDNASDSDSS